MNEFKLEVILNDPILNEKYEITTKIIKELYSNHLKNVELKYERKRVIGQYNYEESLPKLNEISFKTKKISVRHDNLMRKLDKIKYKEFNVEDIVIFFRVNEEKKTEEDIINFVLEKFF